MTIIRSIEYSLAADLPWRSSAQMVEVDRVMVDDFTEVARHQRRSLRRLDVSISGPELTPPRFFLTTVPGRT